MDDHLPAADRRYRTLDMVRGAAALLVTLFHAVNSHPDVDESLVGRVFIHGWIGVFMFFPVSGYAIGAAMDRRENSTVSRFLRRRWRRIFPAYWASVGLTVAIALAALPFNRGRIEELALPPGLWAAVLTLTQVFTTRDGVLNPVYWSLGYEEQFYLVMALALACPHWLRAPGLTAVTALAVAYLWVPAAHVKGLFLDLWPCFAVGYAVYLWWQGPDQRRYAAAIFGLGGLLLASQPSVALLTSMAAAAALTALWRFDERLASLPPAAPLMALGKISFSLYLIHVPIASRVTNGLLRFDAPLWMSVLAAVSVSLAAAVVFFELVEKRFLPSRSRSTAGVPGLTP